MLEDAELFTTVKVGRVRECTATVTTPSDREIQGMLGSGMEGGRRDAAYVVITACVR